MDGGYFTIDFDKQLPPKRKYFALISGTIQYFALVIFSPSSPRITEIIKCHGFIHKTPKCPLGAIESARHDPVPSLLTA